MYAPAAEDAILIVFTFIGFAAIEHSWTPWAEKNDCYSTNSW